MGDAPTSPHPPLGKYAVFRELGRGGMGVVFEAQDTELGRKVALKMLLGSSIPDPWGGGSDEDRFLREAKLSTKLPTHPHIVSVYEAGIIEGKRYLAMEYIEGQSYSAWVKSGSAPAAEQVRILRDVALAVDHAHKQGIIHRDLKPDNILLDARNQPHVTDFGLAKSVGQNVSLSLTASGMVVGTPAYMSPEQALGKKTTDHRTDIYAIGVMLYEILTGNPPFTGESAIEILLKAAKDEVPPPSTVLKMLAQGPVDKALESICLRCLAKEPADRYESAEALASDLTRWLNGEEVRVPRPASTNTPRPSRGIWPWVAALAVGVLILVLGRVKFFEPPQPGVGSPPVEAASPPAADPFPSGLVAYWKLDKGHGTTVSDASGHKLAGKLVNGPRWVKRNEGHTLHFDGVNSHVEISDSSSLDKLRTISHTVAAWYKPDIVPAGDGERNDAGHRILDWSWGGLSFLNSSEFMMQHRAPGRGLTGIASHNVPDAAGVYHHVAGVVDKAAGVVMTFVDGRPQGQKSIDARPGSEPSPAPWRIGIHLPSSGTYRWAAKGAIDSVRVYDRALTAEEIEAIYRSEALGHDR